MLDLGGIPLKAKDRTSKHPLVIGGGIALTLNPEPLADFFDVFILGEAEEILPQFARVFAEARRLELDRQSLLIHLQKQIPGIYVPSLYAVHYFPEGKIQDIVPLEEGLPKRIQISPIKNINAFCTTEVVSSIGFGNGGYVSGGSQSRLSAPLPFLRGRLMFTRRRASAAMKKSSRPSITV